MDQKQKQKQVVPEESYVGSYRIWYEPESRSPFSGAMFLGGWRAWTWDSQLGGPHEHRGFATRMAAEDWARELVAKHLIEGAPARRYCRSAQDPPPIEALIPPSNAAWAVAVGTALGRKIAYELIWQGRSRGRNLTPEDVAALDRASLSTADRMIAEERVWMACNSAIDESNSRKFPDRVQEGVDP